MGAGVDAASVCPTVCAIVFTVVAVVCVIAAIVWVTGPLSPGLATRIDTFRFCG